MHDVNIGEAINKGLKKKGWPQKKFAEMMNMSTSIVNGWVKNQRIPPGDTLIKIALQLDIVADLFPEQQRQQYTTLDIRNEIAEIRQKLDKIEEKLDCKE